MAVKTPMDKFNKMKTHFLVLLLGVFSFSLNKAIAQTHKSHQDKTTILFPGRVSPQSLAAKQDTTDQSKGI